MEDTKPTTIDGYRELHAPARIPADTRPYRRASEPGDELTLTGYGNRHTMRHIGWHGATGAFYSLDEDPSTSEPGSFTPIWLPVHSEPIDDEEEPDTHVDMDLDVIRSAGLTLGAMIGRAMAAATTIEQAINEGIRGEMTWAGLHNHTNHDAIAEPDPIRQTDGTTDGHPESTCRRCGRTNIAWTAPSPLWNEVMRGGNINGVDRFSGIVCPVCFAQLAEEAGVARHWRFYSDRVHVELATVTPSGRVWNEQTWMWEQPAQPATPFVACKAPDPGRPNWFCCRQLGHPDDPNGCLYVHVEPAAERPAEERCPHGCHDVFADAACPDHGAAALLRNQHTAGLAAPRSARDGEPSCTLTDHTGRRCILIPRHRGVCDTGTTDQPAPTTWCGNPDHDDPCEDCDPNLIDAAEALRERMPDAEPGQDNRCAHCGEAIRRVANTDVWKHQRIPTSTLLDHPATPANLATHQTEGTQQQ